MPKELALYLNRQQYQSVISGNTRDVTWLTPKLCGAGAPNTAQKSNAGLSLRAEQFNHLKSENKCFAFSLSLSGAASALGPLVATSKYPMKRPEPVHIENLFNKYVVQYGGELVRNVMPNEPNGPNADYYFRKESVVAELKCLQKDSFNIKDDLPKFQGIIRKWADKKIIPQEDVFGILIGRKPIPECCFPDIQQAVTKTIDRIIYKANKQIEQTKIDLKIPRAKGLLLIANDGNYLYSNTQFLKIIIDLMIRKYSKCSIKGFVYFTVNQASYILDSNLDQHVWVPAYSNGNNKKLSDFVNDFGRKFLTDVYNNFPDDKVVDHKEFDNVEGIELIKKMKYIPKEIVYRKGGH